MMDVPMELLREEFASLMAQSDIYTFAVTRDAPIKP